MSTHTGPQRAVGHGPPGADGALWAQVRAGDRDAFTALYHRHADAVWNHAYRLTASRTAAEDVLAATFLALGRLTLRLLVPSEDMTIPLAPGR